MFSTTFTSWKAFVTKQKLRELKKRIFRLKAMEKPSPYKIIKKPVNNMTI